MGLLGRAVDWLTNRYDQTKTLGEWIHFHHVGNAIMELRGKAGFSCPSCAMGDLLCVSVVVAHDPDAKGRFTLLVSGGYRYKAPTVPTSLEPSPFA